MNRESRGLLPPLVDILDGRHRYPASFPNPTVAGAVSSSARHTSLSSASSICRQPFPFSLARIAAAITTLPLPQPIAHLLPKPAHLCRSLLLVDPPRRRRSPHFRLLRFRQPELQRAASVPWQLSHNSSLVKD